MIKSKVFPILAFCFVLVSGSLRSQAIDIHISEYCTSNIGAQTDNYGENSDWVEIRSTFTSSVSLQNYYLSDDGNNLYKWQFPQDFVLQPGEVKIIWLSGRNEAIGDDVHTNFTISQCNNQELILSTDQGVIRDRIAIKPMLPGHSRGRINNTKLGPDEWRVFTTPSFKLVNSTTDYYLDYAPTPQIHLKEATGSWTVSKDGGFFNVGSKVVQIRLNGELYDTTSQACFDIFYTTSVYGAVSNYPKPNYNKDPQNKTKRYEPADGEKGGFPITQSSVVRAIAVPRPWGNCGPDRYLPSFCETNTYLIEQNHLSIAKDFGVVSFAFDESDTSFFTIAGTKTVHIEYFDDKKFVCEGYAIVNQPPQERWLTKQKGFYATMDDRLGRGCGFTGPIFNVEGLGTSTRTMFPTLHIYAGDIESHSVPLVGDNKSVGTGIRDIFFQTLAAKHDLKVNPLHVKPVVVIKEGKYYGVFHLKEVYDKYYEEFYYGQPDETLTLNYVMGPFENHVTYFDNTTSNHDPSGWATEVYDLVKTQPMQLPSNYAKFESLVDVPGMIDYFVVNSFAVNTHLFDWNVAFGRGADETKPGNKWHFFLWNMPSVLSFTNYPLPGQSNDFNYGRSPCYYYEHLYSAPANTNTAMKSIGEVFKILMTTDDNSGTTTGKFQQAFQRRYMDLLNGPLSCPSLLNHWDFISKLYGPEMKRHDNAAISSFGTGTDAWKKNMDTLKEIINQRCYFHEDNVFNKQDCFGVPGPFPITVDVLPEGAGSVRLNTTVLPEYPWSGRYYESQLTFKAIPSSTNYVFHEWRFANHTPYQPTSVDSVAIDYSSNFGDNVVAVFTDKTKELSPEGENNNLPTGFTPNGDGINDVFRPVGSAEFLTNYEMVVFNRWGQEVFRSTSPTVGWDGRYKGQDAMTGVYAYYVSYRNTKGEDKIVKGNITLTR